MLRARARRADRGETSLTARGAARKPPRLDVEVPGSLATVNRISSSKAALLEDHPARTPLLPPSRESGSEVSEWLHYCFSSAAGGCGSIADTLVSMRKSAT
jgi:hypothetical protein